MCSGLWEPRSSFWFGCKFLPHAVFLNDLATKNRHPFIPPKLTAHHPFQSGRPKCQRPPNRLPQEFAQCTGAAIGEEHHLATALWPVGGRQSPVKNTGINGCSGSQRSQKTLAPSILSYYVEEDSLWILVEGSRLHPKTLQVTPW